MKYYFLKYIFIISYTIKNWKLVIHLLFRTKKFGVDNRWKSSHNSIFAWDKKTRIKSILKIKPIIDNYNMMILRSSIGFIPWKHFIKIVSKKKFNKMYPHNNYYKELKSAFKTKSKYGESEY